MTNTSVHRLLDEAFAGLPATPDVQDLKEEIRANLLDRVAELTAAGLAPDEAARRAVDELGDVRGLVLDGEAPSVGTGSAGPSRAPVSRRYVTGVVVASAVILLPLGGFAWMVAVVSGDDPNIRWVAPLVLGGLLLIAPAVGWIVSASLLRETAARYGMPRRRAVAYGAAWTLVVTALVVSAVGYSMFLSPAYVLLMAPVLVIGTAWLAFLLATQTNRRKLSVRR